MENPKKTLVLLGDVSPEYRKQVEADSNYEILPVSIGQFISGEGYAEIYHGENENHAANKQKLNGANVVVIQSTHHTEEKSTDQRCTDLVRAVNTLKRYQVKNITVALPFAAYDRQDREFEGRFVSVEAENFAWRLKNAGPRGGADRVIRITPHSKDAMGFYTDAFGKNDAIALSPVKVFADKIRADCARKGISLDKIAVGAPDGADKPGDEGQRRAFELARELFGDLPDDELKKHMFFLGKKHVSVNETQIVPEKSVAEVAGKYCVVIDDMIDGGSTIKKAAKFLKSEKGAAGVIACCTHAIVSKSTEREKEEAAKLAKDFKERDALKEILTETVSPGNPQPLVDQLVATDTVPTIYEKIAALRGQIANIDDRVSVLSAAPMVMQTLGQLPTIVKRSPAATAR